jgi:hypothetical protein
MLSRPSWLQFSLRTMLVVTLLIALAIGLPRQRSLSQHRAARRLTDRGAEVWLASDVRSQQSQVQWLIFGDNRYDFVFRVSFRDQQLTANDIALVRQFPDLPELRMTNCHLDTAATSELGTLTSLRGLRVEGGSLAGLEAVAWENVSQLGWLVLEDIDLTQLDCRRLSGLKDCTELKLASDSLADQQLKLLTMQNLNMLSLVGSNFSDAGLACLAGSPNLQFLSVRNSRVTGSGLRSLPATAELLMLNLDGSGITAEGLQNLSRHRLLSMVQVRSTPLSKEDILNLAAILPKECVLQADSK